MNKELQWILREKYHNKPSPNLKNDIERWKEGKPLSYIIGFTEFLGCKIDLSKKPLIPRPETEFWAGEAIEEIVNPSSQSSSGRFGSEPQRGASEESSGHSDSEESSDSMSSMSSMRSMNSMSSMRQNLRILDIFAGSGCIGIAVLKHIENSHVVFADQEKNCLDQIKINLELNNINKKRFEIIRSDIFNNLNHKSEIINLKSYRFDYIFANPPYIAIKRNNKIQKSVLEYEPHAALFGGKDGLFYIKKFLSDAKSFLKPGGKIYMEFDSIQKNNIAKLLKKNCYKAFKIHKDQYGKWRYCIARF